MRIVSRYEQETTNFLEPFNLALARFSLNLKSKSYFHFIREQEGGMAEVVARAQEMILDLDDPSMAIVNDEILTNFLFFQSYQVCNFKTQLYKTPQISSQMLSQAREL